MAQRDLVVIGGSAGGLEVLLRVLDRLPADFPAAILVVLHIPARGSGLLATVIQRRCLLPVAFAEDGAPIPYGGVAIAPPDHHLTVTPDNLKVVRGPHENRHRPALDPLFRSAAEAFGPRTIGVVLSGSGSDGAAGMVALRDRGGYLIVQDTADAIFPIMPQAVLDVVDVDARVPSDDLAAHLDGVVAEQVSETKEPVMTANRGHESVPDPFIDTPLTRDQPGNPSAFSCPDWGGVHWEAQQGNLTQFRCRVGHAYSQQSLMDAQDETYEAALWAALRALEEKIDLYSSMAQQSEARGQTASRARFLDRKAELESHLATLKTMLGSGDGRVVSREAVADG